MELEYKIIVAMAKEIAALRKNNDLEWGEFCDDKDYYDYKKIIKEFKPDIVIGTGGYICGATIWEANKLKIPTMLHESNAFPGKAVKMLAKKTNTIMVSFEDAIPRIESKNKFLLKKNYLKLSLS